MTSYINTYDAIHSIQPEGISNNITLRFNVQQYSEKVLNF